MAARRSGHGDPADMASELAERARAMSRSWKLLREQEAQQRREREEEEQRLRPRAAASHEGARADFEGSAAGGTGPPQTADAKADGSDAEEEEDAEEVFGKPISFYELLEEIRECPYTSERYPLLLDPSGRASRFLRYRGRLLQALMPADLEPESMRRGLTQCLHHGAYLILDFHDLPDFDLDALLCADHFPEAAFDPSLLFDPAVYGRCLREEDVFPPRASSSEDSGNPVQHRMASQASSQLEDAPDGVNEDFEPQESFRLVVICAARKVPKFLRGRLAPRTVDGAGAKARAGQWSNAAGGSAGSFNCPVKEASAEDQALLAAAYDADLAEVRRLLELRADPRAVDGRGNDSLSEAAVVGNLEVVQELLAHNPPLGTNPNSSNVDGRTCLHRAAFHGHVATVQVLLENGADPRMRTLGTGERPFDMSVNQETQASLEAWDIEDTERMCEARRKALEEEEDRLAIDAEDKRQLELRRRTQHLFGLVSDGDVDSLETELTCLTRGRDVNSLRDARGNAALHVAADLNRLECAEVLVEVGGSRVDVRDAKGWTPLAIAAFRGFKRMCVFLLAKGADPSIPNAYRRCAHSLAKDEEVAEVLRCRPEEWRSVRAAAAEEDADADAAADEVGATAAAALDGSAADEARSASPKPRVAQAGGKSKPGRSEAKSKARARRGSAGSSAAGASASPPPRRSSAKRRTL